MFSVAFSVLAERKREAFVRLGKRWKIVYFAFTFYPFKNIIYLNLTPTLWLFSIFSIWSENKCNLVNVVARVV